MHARSWIPLAIAAPITLALLIGLRSGMIPRGVAGEWEWPALPAQIARVSADPITAVVGLGFYAIVVGFGSARLGGKAGIGRETLAIGLLAIASVAAQVALHAAAPEGYGLAKWVAIDQPGASGYFTIARTEVDDPRRFLAAYPRWIARQDALHIGTHPPGLFISSWASLKAFDGRPEAARRVVQSLPGSARDAFRILLGSRSNPERAAIAAIGALTMLASALTIVPLYLLARASLSAPGAWASASLWPLIPSAILFQPTSDTAFPLLSTSALALAAWASRGKGQAGIAMAAGAGVILAVGMQFSLVFLGIGLVAALIYLTDKAQSPRERIARFLATGAGFLAITIAWWLWTSSDPFQVWWINQANHRRFYTEFPRSYLPWLIANPIELVIGLGIPTAACALFGGKSAWVSWLTLAVLAILTISGRNLSEVGRLWLPFMPALVVAAGSGRERLQAGAATLLATVGLLAIQTIGLEHAIQVVYPF